MTTDNSVTLAGVSWMFACAPTDTAITRVLADDILATLTNSSAKLVLLTCTDHESRMTTQAILKEFTHQRRLPDYHLEVPPGVQNADGQMAALARSNPAAVLIIAGAEDSARLVLALHENDGFHQAGQPGSPLVFGSHRMGCSRFQELAAQAAEGVRFPLLFVPAPADTNMARFKAAFATDHRRPPDYTAVLTYDATRLLIDAIRRGGLNRVRVREALTEGAPWIGLAGPIRFDGTGQNVRTNVAMGTILQGAVISLPKP
jgi:branched-chain amino acid transport system substrate-binding protein